MVNGGVIANMPTHEAMANFIGANREAVSRAIARMVKTGVITVERKKVVIKDLSGLLYRADDLADV